MGTLIALASSLFIFIRSYLKASDTLSYYIKEYQLDPNQFQETQTWVIILLLSLLIAATLFGVAMIFIYYQKLIKLYRSQQNFINGFTHELKTPIASLRLYLDTFKKHDLSALEKEKYLNYMISDTERLTMNVDQILHIARVEDKKTKPSLVTLNPYKFTQKFLAKNIHYFDEVDIIIDQEDGFDYNVHVEPKLFEMVIMNIMTNAINYNQNTNPKIKIFFKQDKGDILIHFKDNGIGIESSEFKNIFKKMYQVGKSTKGTGLGLYLASSIMKIHKGGLMVDSEGYGHGSQFIIKLPAQKVLS